MAFLPSSRACQLMTKQDLRRERLRNSFEAPTVSYASKRSLSAELGIGTIFVRASSICLRYQIAIGTISSVPASRTKMNKRTPDGVFMRVVLNASTMIVAVAEQTKIPTPNAMPLANRMHATIAGLNKPKILERLRSVVRNTTVAHSRRPAAKNQRTGYRGRVTAQSCPGDTGAPCRQSSRDRHRLCSACIRRGRSVGARATSAYLAARPNMAPACSVSSR